MGSNSGYLFKHFLLYSPLNNERRMILTEFTIFKLKSTVRLEIFVCSKMNKQVLFFENSIRKCIATIRPNNGRSIWFTMKYFQKLTNTRIKEIILKNIYYSVPSKNTLILEGPFNPFQKLFWNKEFWSPLFVTWMIENYWKKRYKQK